LETTAFAPDSRYNNVGMTWNENDRKYNYTLPN